MKDFVEIRWHGRGGQGTITAAKVLACAAIMGDQYIQAFPEYVPERAGAPLRAFNRIGTKPISVHCGVTNPDVVVIVDPTLLETANVTAGSNDDTTFVVNTVKSPQEVKKTLGLSESKVFTVDATLISIDTLGRPMPNTPMLGAFVKAVGIVEMDHLINQIRDTFGHKFSNDIVEANISAVKRAYEEVKEA